MGQFVEMMRHDYKKSAAIYRSTCDDYKYGPSCLRFAQRCIAGRGTPADPLLAFEYNKKACQLGEAESCLAAGMANTAIDSVKLRVETNYPLALDYLKQGCALGNADSCYLAGGMYLTGIPSFIEKDTSLAYKFDVKACLLGNGFACANLSGVFASIGADRLQLEGAYNIYFQSNFTLQFNSLQFNLLPTLKLMEWNGDVNKW